MNSNHFITIMLASVFILFTGCAIAPSPKSAAKPTVRDIIYTACIPVEIRRVEEKAGVKGEENEKIVTHYFCSVVAGMCEENLAEESCKKNLHKYDEALRKTGNSLLHQAAYYGRADLAKTMIEIGVDLDMHAQGLVATIPFGRGWTPLMAAAAEGHEDAVLVLIQAGADVNAKNDLGRTALMFAANYGYYSIAKNLLINGADPNIISNYKDGWPALIAAAYKGNRNVVNLLLEHGADAAIKDKNNKTALEWAEKQGHSDIVRILENLGINK